VEMARNDVSKICSASEFEPYRREAMRVKCEASCAFGRKLDLKLKRAPNFCCFWLAFVVYLLIVLYIAPVVIVFVRRKNRIAWSRRYNIILKIVSL
jgi:hypothetical protein